MKVSKWPAALCLRGVWQCDVLVTSPLLLPPSERDLRHAPSGTAEAPIWDLRLGLVLVLVLVLLLLLSLLSLCVGCGAKSSRGYVKAW